jgi:2-methylcitrate dehydratase PrpD
MTAPAQTATPTAFLIDWALDCYQDGVAEADAEAVRYFLLDHLANAIGGLAAESSRAMLTFARARTGGVPALGGTPLHEEYAALVAGTSAHALEFDDTHQPSSSHPGSGVFPSALTVATVEGRTFEEFAAAVVAGYEVSCRVGLAATARGQYERGFHPTGTSGVFGATVAAGLLAGLDRAQLVHAMGIALSVSAGSMAFLADGAWTKRMHPGWAAHSAIIATRLAALGYTGPSEPLAGPDGFLHSYSGRSQPELLTAGLGEDELAIHRTSLKAHSCCRYMQAPIDAVLQLMREADAGPDDVEEIAVGVLEAGWSIIAEPEAQKRRPQNEVDAQFSMAYGAAAAALFGEVTSAQARPEVLASPDLAALMDRVRCFHDPALDALFPARWPARVQLTLRDGRTLEAYVEYPKGDPENPLSDEELETKFHALTGPVIAEARQAEILDALRRLGGDVSPAELQALVASATEQ